MDDGRIEKTRSSGAGLALLAAAAAVATLVLTAPRAQAELPALERVRVLETPRPIADAELVDQDGRVFPLTRLQGRVAFVLFGFTSCQDVCPAAMERLRQLRDTGGLDGDDVAYVMISVDGERDTPDAMRRFLAKYSTDFVGLTAEPRTVEPIAKSFSAAFFKGHAGHGGHYDVAHSPQIFVVDANGLLRAECYGASIDAMAGTARALLDEAR
jgi:protein SCO1